MDFFADVSPTWLWLMAAWLAVLGGCVGSFLNVVVYRLPAGKSLVHPGSYCPKCNHPIRWYDNVPVLGWFALRGKCRDCGEPISFRYPLVEALTAAIFFGLAWVELFSGGANLPIILGKHQTIEPITCPSELVVVYAFHLLLLCTLLSAALITHDRQHVPPRLFVPALLVGVVAPLVCPYLHLGVLCTHDNTRILLLARLYKTFIHVVAGLVVGWVFEGLMPRCANGKDVAAILLAAVCVSLFLGFEAILLLGAAALILSLLEQAMRWLSPGLPVVSPMIWLALLVPVWIVFWQPLAAMCPLAP